MEKPIFTGLSHVCIFVDDVKDRLRIMSGFWGQCPTSIFRIGKTRAFSGGRFY